MDGPAAAMGYTVAGGAAAAAVLAMANPMLMEPARSGVRRRPGDDPAALAMLFERVWRSVWQLRRYVRVLGGARWVSLSAACRPDVRRPPA